MAGENGLPVKTLPGKMPATVASVAVRQTRWHFFLVWFFIVAQGYTIPLLTVGPSWAIWPGLADFAMLALFPAVLIWRLPAGIVSRPNQQLLKILAVIFALCLHSFFLFRLIRAINGEGLTGDIGFTTGVYQLYRLAQFFFLFYVVSNMPMTEYRMKVLAFTSVGVLIFMFLTIFSTYTGLISPLFYVQHLPDSPNLVGPWNIYWTYDRLKLTAGFGSVSYNHAYTAMQVVTLMAFYFLLRGSRQSVIDVPLIALCNFTVFISESRAGLAAILVYSFIFLGQRPRYLYLSVFIGLTGVTLVLAGVISNPLSRLISEETLERNVTLLDATNTENLSDRDLIWEQRINFLNEDLTRWLLGTGFGNTRNSGSNAHMLPLHLIVETGIFGLTIFSLLAIHVLRLLWKYDRYMKPVFWLTAAQLISSATQETFYPVSSFNYYIGLYLVLLAIVLRQDFQEPQKTPAPAAA